MRLVVTDFGAPGRSYLSSALPAEGFDVSNEACAENVYNENTFVFNAHHADDVVCSAIARVRQKSSDAIIVVVSDRDSLAERLSCYAAGADECLFRPFHLVELAAKIRALKRGRSSEVSFALLPGGDALVDCGMLELCVGARRQSLTKREVELLSLLSRSGGGIIDRETVIRGAWGAPSSATSNSVDVYVGYVRRKLRVLGSNITVRTIRGVGFTLTHCDETSRA